MLILASGSSTRKALLAGTGLRFEASPAQIDERAVEAQLLGKAAAPAEIARGLATAKALAVGEKNPEALVIGADQVLALGESRFHKPRNRAEAAQQLDQLAGKTHALHSGLALTRGSDILWAETHSAHLNMRAFTAAERDTVLDLEGDAVLGSVGAYRLEGPSIRLFERIEGEYFTILGLPLLPLLAALRQYAPELLGK